MEKIYHNSLQQELSVLGLGGAALSGEGGGYGFGPLEEDQAERLIKSALELGINVFDTAPIYGFGLSEERLARYLKIAEHAFIITKGGVDWHSNKRVNMTNGPKVIERMLHESLKRLKRDVIDMYMIHWPDNKVDIRHPLEILFKAKEQGKIRFVGLANTHQEDLLKAQELGEIHGLQAEHNYWNTQNFQLKEELAPQAHFSGWGVLDKGILSGRVTLERQFHPTDARSWAPWWRREDVKAKLERIEKLKTKLSPLDLSLKEFSLLYAKMMAPQSTLLIGSKSSQDLHNMANILEDNHKFQILKSNLPSITAP
jgi:myo-inositol catabolism protein IolS